MAGSEGSGDGGGWRVFISHTSELRDFPRGMSYVAAVERAVSAAGHVIVDMTDFPAADQPAAQLCENRVRGCDVYVGVLGTRYGSPVKNMPQVSYTELEFDAATEAGLDRLVFLLDTDAEDVGIPVSGLIDHEFGARQDGFRRRVRDSELVTQLFASPAELGQLVERSLRELAGTRRNAVLSKTRLDLDRLQERFTGIASEANDTEGYAAELASLRRLVRAISNEISDCPLLFTITEQPATGTRRLRPNRRRCRLVLWCEHPGHWHPWDPASYTLDITRDRLVRTSPYMTLILKGLKVAVPIAQASAGTIPTAKQLAFTQQDLDLMTAFLAELPTPMMQERFSAQMPNQITRAEGQAARAIRSVLFELDPMRAFGDLRRVQVPSGDFLWVCPHHYLEYDPGLPIIPEYLP